MSSRETSYPRCIKSCEITLGFANCSLHAPEAVNAKMTEWHSDGLIGSQMRSLGQNNCAVFITKHQSLKVCEKVAKEPILF